MRWPMLRFPSDVLAQFRTIASATLAGSTRWSRFGVHIGRFGRLASIWRPKRTTTSLLFSVGTVCK